VQQAALPLSVAAPAAAHTALLAPATVGESVAPYLVRLLQFEADETPDVDLVDLAVDLLTDVLTEPAGAADAATGKGSLLKVLSSRWVSLLTLLP